MLPLGGTSGARVPLSRRLRRARSLAQLIVRDFRFASRTTLWSPKPTGSAVECFRGSETDVLGRLNSGSTGPLRAGAIARITADDVAGMDPAVVDFMVESLSARRPPTARQA